jgi:cysteinyl-tRNA synthetase
MEPAPPFSRTTAGFRVQELSFEIQGASLTCMLRLRNSLTRQVEEIRPLDGGVVKLYACGPTVYRPVHVGNLRSFLLPDFVQRVLAYQGLEVYKVMNVTDVGHMTDELTDEGRDRMLLAADDEGLTTKEIAEKYTQAFFDATAAIGIRGARVYPRASEHIPQIIELVAKLLERGHAYAHEGNIFYDVTTFPDYGKLSGQSLDDMRAAHRIEVDPAKRNHQDFTLWVAAGPRRELVFDSPWGTGYPGWHIECSAMSLYYLGEHIDLHTGGVDNRFPHHENEIAQSEGAVGHRVVQTWVHGEHLLMSGAKMAKSAGNVITIESVKEAGCDPLAFRYLCMTGRYGRQVDFTEESLQAADTALRRLRERMALLGETGTVPTTDADLQAAIPNPAALFHHQQFMSSVTHDLDLPAALVVVGETLADESLPPLERWRMVASWDEILGLELVGSASVSAEQQRLIAEREKAREAGDFARADAIRDLLRAEGIDLLDSPEGTRWTLR